MALTRDFAAMNAYLAKIADTHPAARARIFAAAIRAQSWFDNALELDGFRVRSAPAHMHRARDAAAIAGAELERVRLRHAGRAP